MLAKVDVKGIGSDADIPRFIVLGARTAVQGLVGSDCNLALERNGNVHGVFILSTTTKYHRRNRNDRQSINGWIAGRSGIGWRAHCHPDRVPWIPQSTKREGENGHGEQERQRQCCRKRGLAAPA